MTGTTVLTTGNTDYNALELIRASLVYNRKLRTVCNYETKHCMQHLLVLRRGTNFRKNEPVRWKALLNGMKRRIDKISSGITGCLGHRNKLNRISLEFRLCIDSAENLYGTILKIRYLTCAVSSERRCYVVKQVGK